MLGNLIHKKWKGQLINESLTNLLELLFLTVLALPKASSSGLDCRMMSLTCCEETDAMSCKLHHRQTIQQVEIPHPC